MRSVIAVLTVFAFLAGVSAAQRQKQAASSAVANANVAAQLEQIEHKWAEAEVKRQPDMIAPYLEATIVQTNPDGSVSARKEVLESIGKGDPSLKAVDLADMKTQSYGDAAVVMGRYTERHESGGRQRSIVGRFTDTYVKRGGQWKCVASHDSVDVKE